MTPHKGAPAPRLIRRRDPGRTRRPPRPRDDEFFSDEEFDDPRAPFELETCDAESRRAGFDAGYGHGYHRGSRPPDDRDDDDRYAGYEEGYQAGYDAVYRDESDDDPESHCEESLAWWEGHYAEMDESEA